MGLSETANYILWGNPVTQTLVSVTKEVVKPLGKVTGLYSSTAPEQSVKIITERLPLWQLANQSGPFIKLAGISGALAVGMGAYGAHKKYPKDKVDELKAIYEKGNQFHFLHTLALIGVPLCRHPKLSGSLIIVGTTLFSGACYHHAFTGDDRYGKFAPVGGTLLILGWLAMVV